MSSLPLPFVRRSSPPPRERVPSFILLSRASSTRSIGAVVDTHGSWCACSPNSYHRARGVLEKPPWESHAARKSCLQRRCTMLSVPSPVHTRLCGPGTRPRDPPHPLRALERWIECPLIAHRATLRTGLTQLLGACRHCTWEPHIGHRRADALAAHTQRSPVLPQLTCARSVRLQPGFSSRRGAYVFDGAGRVVWATALALWRCPARCHGGRQLGTQFGYAAGRSYATARHGGRLRPVCVYIRSCALALQAPCVLRCAGRKAESQEPLTRPPADRVGSERLEVGGRNSTCSQWCER